MNALHRFKTQFLAKSPKVARHLQVVIELCALGGLAALIWLGAPHLNINGSFPFLSPEKRLYLIAFFALLWFLKFSLIDVPHLFHFQDPLTRKKIKAQESRFQGVIQFLKQTTVARHGARIKLNKLPWYLLIGSTNSGKTTLLANAKIHYVLQRQLKPQEIENISPSEQCDFWVTRDISIIDVPGKYLAIPTLSKTTEEKPMLALALFRSFLKLIKKYRGKDGLDGVIIALSIADILKQGDPKKYQIQLRHLFSRLAEIAQLSKKSLPCYLVITKCDQLSGFNEFFGESSDEEIIQSWGISLPKPKAGEKIHDLCQARLDMLVKKLNQQLLFRLHQERNPMARPYIKDFPLQVERLKECVLDFIKKFSQANFNFSMQGIYFTSSLQDSTEKENAIIDAKISSERAIQLFKEPKATSRAYFIKQFLLQGLMHGKHEQKIIIKPNWTRRAAYVLSLSLITLAALTFGKDFEYAVKHAYTIQNTLSEYQLAIQKSHDTDEQLMQTLTLLSQLQATANQNPAPHSVKNILRFYSSKSQQKSAVVYTHALNNILIPEVKAYLSEYLKKPVNRNSENIYAALKAYIMLGDQTHFQPEFIESTMQSIAPSNMTPEQKQALQKHLALALSTYTKNLKLDATLINDTRRYLMGLPNFQLSYIILRNNNNNSKNAIDLSEGINLSQALATHDSAKKIQTMFTAKAFTNIFTQDTAQAAMEATNGNWVLGTNALGKLASADDVNLLLQQLRTTYITNYVNTWEGMLSSIRLSKPQNLSEMDALILNLASNDSPLLRLLQTLHDNTYFDPIAKASPKLQNIGVLVDKNNDVNNLLYQIFTGLQSLHQYVNSIVTAENEKKAAFEAVSARMQHVGTPDAITQLRLIADKSPEPVKSWLNKITNDTWRFLFQDASRYMDLSWQEQVSHAYESDIANHYPFSQNATQEVSLNKFTEFFGNPGTMMSFYQHYLAPFIDTSSTEWRFKTMDNLKLNFPEETLKQIQTAYQIHHMFFPNGDDKLLVQFALQPYQVSKLVKSVHVRINAKNITDQASTRNSHLLSWPNKYDSKMTAIQLTLNNQKKLNREYPGDWGWFKLINQATVNAVTNKELLVNFSESDYPVKYLLFTQTQHNPFNASNLQHLQLPKHLA